ncbi:MAG: hypothetical protein ACK4F5_15435 [Aliihoeflea sp.]
MALQNRVDVFGALLAVSDRGTFTGNRGVIHDPATRTLLKRRWSTKSWIVCALEHPRGIRRDPMGRNGRSGGAGWTELFFLDEVTALAAGHRPCFYCRREAAQAFVDAWRADAGHPGLPLPELDRRLHGERRVSGGVSRRLEVAQVADLPEGAVVAAGKRAYALRHERLLPWAFAGYGAPIDVQDLAGLTLELLTPPSTLAALRTGYRPAWHHSAQS